ncbi:MAG: hypothetical protein C5B59_09415 [Bacteroidetes bacterium]|nr:MAG: hypothetical protein C5B59_09415 [Bacteroidota bacterium]
METVCKNCNQPAAQNFCSNCGQKTSTTRFNHKHLIHDFIHGFFHIDHGIVYTAWELLRNPGRVLRDYLGGKRIRYFNPFTFLLLVGGFGAFVLPRLHWTSFFFDVGIIAPKAADQHAWNSSLQHFSLRLLLFIPFYALISRLFYFNKDYNYSEHLIAQTYIRTEVSLFMILFSPIQLLIQTETWAKPLKLFFVVGYVVYVAWAFAGLFDGKITFLSMVKGFFVALFSIAIELIIVNWIIIRQLPF